MYSTLIFVIVIATTHACVAASLSTIYPSYVPVGYSGKNLTLWYSSGFNRSEELEAVFHRVDSNDGTLYEVAKQPATVLSTGSLTMEPPNIVAVGQYIVTLKHVASSTTKSSHTTVYRVHGSWTLQSIASEPETQVRYNVAGGTSVTAKIQLDPGSEFPSSVDDVLVKFQDQSSTQVETVRVPVSQLVLPSSETLGTGSLNRELTFKLPVWWVPETWEVSCTSEADYPSLIGAVNTTRACAPDVITTVLVSLDDGESWGSSSVQLVYGYHKPLRVAFVFFGPVTDFGWTYIQNQGRLALKDDFGDAVDVSTYFEHVPEGEFVTGQANKGKTFETGTAVPEYFEQEDGTLVKNDYYVLWNILKTLCDEKYDLVFTESFGYMSQTVDVSGGYRPCGRPTLAEPNPPHTTHMVHLSGYLTNSISSTAFAKIYQMRYLAGLVAGEMLKLQSVSGVPIHRGYECVSYIAAYPLPEVQRGINAFAIGCRKIFPNCIVKVFWTGTWHSAEIETAAARYMYNVAQCDIIAQHSDTVEPQVYYSKKGGVGFGYNSDHRSIVGDSVLTSPMFVWKPVYAYFINQLLRKEWNPKQRDPDFGGFGFLQEQLWTGVAEESVQLAPRMSPKVRGIVQRRVQAEYDTLRSAPGDESFKHIFCGPIKKRWVYSYKEGNAGPRDSGCGFQPNWKRLDEPEHVNLKHFRDQSFNALPDGLTEARSGDCLFGVYFPGQALLFTAYPDPFDEDQVFSDFLVDGVELLEPGIHPEFGQVHDSETHGCFTSFGTTGDRFFKMPTYYELCEGKHWQITRDQCNPSTFTTPLIYTWIDQDKQCGDNYTSEGLITVPAQLPYFESGPSCDFLPLSSSFGLMTMIWSLAGTIACGSITFLAFKHRSEVVFRSSQVHLLIAMGVGCVVANLGGLVFIGENTRASCILRVWMFNISFTMTISCLWVKVYRLTRIFGGSKSYKKLKLRDTDMFRIALQIIACDVTIMLLWTLIDPPLPSEIPVTNYIIPVAGIGTLTRTVCMSVDPSFTAIQLFFKGGLIVSCAVNLFRARNAPGKYMARKFVAMSAYNIITFGAVMLLVEFALEYNSSLMVQVRVACICLSTCFMMAFLVFPNYFVVIGFWAQLDESTKMSHASGVQSLATIGGEVTGLQGDVISGKTGGKLGVSTSNATTAAADFRIDASIFKNLPSVNLASLPKDEDDDAWAADVHFERA